MRFLSTRGRQAPVSFSDAIRDGLAGDGGLYVPERWPELSFEALPGALPTAELCEPEGLAAIGSRLFAPLLAGDPLEPALPDIARDAFNFPAPLRVLDAGARLSALELYHGPTAAFKDFGARFLAAALARLPRRTGRPLLVLVATSGDTGGAVAAAFHRREGCEVAVLFPRDGVSPTQRQQLTCWNDNVRAFAVHGSFDDCQRLAKQALGDARLRTACEPTSANSINLGRLLPQCVYYAAASAALWREHHAASSFVIPSGNLGNATACVWARRLGAPIGAIVLAHNANRTVPDYLEQGTLRVRSSIATLASAMDVGDPSNLERLHALYADAAALRAAGLSAVSIDDAAIRSRIRIDFERYGRVWCPHSATAAEAYARLSPSARMHGPWVIVATAHAAKFRETVEPLIGEPLTMPESLGRLFERPSSAEELEPDLPALERALGVA